MNNNKSVLSDADRLEFTIDWEIQDLIRQTSDEYIKEQLKYLAQMFEGYKYSVKEEQDKPNKQSKQKGYLLAGGGTILGVVIGLTIKKHRK